jgi:hypothetical protein
VTKRKIALAGLALAIAAFAIWFVARPKTTTASATVADLSVVHPGVKVSDVERRGLSRLAEKSVVATDSEGRARLRLDDGTRPGRSLDEARGGIDEIQLESGRLFVLGVSGARSKLKLGEAVVRTPAGNIGLEKTDGGGRVYAANEEIVVEAGGQEHKVRSGESATIQGSAVTVAPEKAFDDWTGGLAAPRGGRYSRRAVGELWVTKWAPDSGSRSRPCTRRTCSCSGSAVTKVSTHQRWLERGRG